MATRAPEISSEGSPAQGGQNVTLHLPKEMIRRAKAVAAQRGMSLSRYFAEGMERLLKNEDEYDQAYRSWREDMKNPHHGGGLTIKSRDEIYDRK